MLTRHAPFALLLLVGGCALNSWDRPYQPTPNSYGPCGPVWVSCRPLVAACCPQGYACPSSATDTECQDVGNELAFGAARDAGARPKTVPMRGETWVCRGSSDPARVPACVPWEGGSP